MSTRDRFDPERVRGYLERPSWRPRSFSVDVTDHGDEFRVAAELPGLRKQDLDIRVRKDKLQIIADYGEDGEEATYLRRERDRGEVQRVVRLPEPVDEKHVSASYNDGVLRVTLRKLHRPTRIEIT